MNTWNNEIQKAMTHPTKRRIIECLQDSNLSFSELLEAIGETNHGRFGYHLRGLKGFVELEPSTKRYCLTERGTIVAACIRDFRLITSVSKEAVQYAQNLRIGDHAVLFYENEDFKRRISFPFLKSGLLRGEAVLYIVSEQRLDSEVREVKKYGIDLDRIPRETFRIMSAYDWYLKKGEAHAQTIVSNWVELIEEKKKAGFAGVCVAGEIDVFFDYTNSEELLRYEESLGKQLIFDLCALCLYDRDRLNREQFVRVLNCHGHIISKGVVGKTIA